MTTTATSTDRLRSVRYACERLGVSRPTLTDMRRRGLIAYLVVGTRGVRIPESAIDAFIRDNTERQPDVALAAPRRRPPSGERNSRSTAPRSCS